jgi:hypothetical protein
MENKIAYLLFVTGLDKEVNVFRNPLPPLAKKQGIDPEEAEKAREEVVLSFLIYALGSGLAANYVAINGWRRCQLINDPKMWIQIYQEKLAFHNLYAFLVTGVFEGNGFRISLQK